MTPDLVIKALIAGTVDLARSGTHFGVIAAARGAEIKIIGGSNYGYPYQVIGNPQFKTLTDLKGQKIAGASLASITDDNLQRRHAAPRCPAVGLHPAFRRWQPGEISSRRVRPGGCFAGRGAAVQFQIHRGRQKSAAQLLRLRSKILQYTSFFATTKSLAAEPPAVRPLHARDQPGRCVGSTTRRTRKAAVELMVQTLEGRSSDRGPDL